MLWQCGGLLLPLNGTFTKKRTAEKGETIYENDLSMVWAGRPHPSFLYSPNPLYDRSGFRYNYLIVNSKVTTDATRKDDY